MNYCTPQYRMCSPWVALTTLQFTSVSPWAWQFLNAGLSLGSVSTFVRSVGIFNDDLIANLPTSLPVKEYWKSVRSRQSYKQKCSNLFFSGHSVQCTLYLQQSPHLWLAITYTLTDFDDFTAWWCMKYMLWHCIHPSVCHKPGFCQNN